MAFTKKAGIHPSVIFSLIGVLFLAATALYLSGTFQQITTILLKPQATALQPKITERFADPFKTATINTDTWRVATTGDASVVETPTDNLRITVPAGHQNNTVKSGNLIFKQDIKDNGDFRAIAVLYRPIITGEGAGATGIRFSSTGSQNDEAAVIQWIVRKPASGPTPTPATVSKVSFVIRASNGTKLESEQVDLPTTVAVFQLVRVNKTYRAYYKLGADLSADLGWKPLGTEQNATLGQDGNLVLFTHNAGVNGKFPQVIGRFDQVNIGWEGKPAAPDTTYNFKDAFADGNIGTVWTVWKNLESGSVVQENTKDNLKITVLGCAAPTMSNCKVSSASLVRINPTVEDGKNFAFNAAIFKPVVNGPGPGASGIAFQSNTNVDDEAANVRWVVNGTQSRLVFAVRAPDGSLLERASVNVTVKKVTLRLARTGNKYTAWYRTGDTDTDWVKIGQEENSSLGGDGKLALFATNIGAGNPKQFPHVISQFDGASGSVQK